MTSYLLFCTAQVPLTTINALLQTPQHNFFSLVRDPNQSSFDPLCTAPPVAPFESGFRGHTSAQIRDFIAARLPETPEGSDLEPCQYALLDERSVDTESVVLGHSYSTLGMRDPEAMTEEELEAWRRELDGLEDEVDDAWREWRVRFGDAERMSTRLGFEEDFTTKLYDERFVAAFTGEDGIFDLEAALGAFAGDG